MIQNIPVQYCSQVQYEMEDTKAWAFKERKQSMSTYFHFTDMLVVQWYLIFANHWDIKGTV